MSYVQVQASKKSREGGANGFSQSRANPRGGEAVEGGRSFGDLLKRLREEMAQASIAKEAEVLKMMQVIDLGFLIWDLGFGRPRLM